MLTLAVDTATAGIVVGVVSVTAHPHVLAERRTHSPARHGETVPPAIAAVLIEAGCTPSQLEAVVVGIGPGPFTGLRVGIVSAAAYADALGVPVYGVGSLDAVALGLPEQAGLTVVATDARRREVYWAIYVDGERVDGPNVGTPADLSDRLGGRAADRVVGGGAMLYDLPGAENAGPTAAGLVAATGRALVDRQPPVPLRAAYLRRPDAVELAARTPAGRA
ncbi:MAG: tRNA (adenosine(37)-N6)-threonylcarbamoyltransferase complex dimerization subunit type 1 TsaB [Geodermatophilaceae bacterium]|nr:tRNA (adenosine(37)-N6)-threonylcarbamoyltransferase complex dimerization subunit type 1 TsaB [Geodermatophilaceae bacterium]